MGGLGGQNWELDSFHAYSCESFVDFFAIKFVVDLVVWFYVFSFKYLVMLEQVKLLFAGERKVCDSIFEGFDSLSDQCFAEVTTSSVTMLLSFGEAIARSKRSPEKLFVLLDMYEIMQELNSEVQAFEIQIHVRLLCDPANVYGNILTKSVGQVSLIFNTTEQTLFLGLHDTFCVSWHTINWINSFICSCLFR